MDDRVKLVNKVSEMILKHETDFKVIKNLVKEYDILLEEVIRNFYELKEDSEVPLFELCEYLRNGRNNYDMSKEEFKSHIMHLLVEINSMFDIELKIEDVL